MIWPQRKFRGTSMMHDADTDLPASAAYLGDAQLDGDPRGRRVVEAENALVRRHVERLPAGALVADVPCGNGRMSRWVAQRPDLSLVALDYNPNMLAAMALHHAPALLARRVRADVLALPLPDRSVDLLLNIRLMHHIADRQTQVRMYRQIARVTRGTVITTFWTTHCWRYLRRRLWGRPIKSFPVSPAHFRAVVEEAGLAIEDWVPVRPWVEYLCLVVCRPRARPQASAAT